jgi:hypothetical protein
VFWGRDAIAVASDFEAKKLASPSKADIFGWEDMPVADALRLALSIDALRSDHRRFAVDFRPHTHHWQVMRDVRATPTQSGVLEIAGARLCMFMTTWGDGRFPVEVGLDAAEDVLLLQIELGYEDGA